MNRRYLRWFSLIIVVLLAMLACNFATPQPSDSVDPSTLYTQAASTLIAQLTQAAIETASTAVTQLQPTGTPQPPTEIPSPTASPLPSDTPASPATQTPVIPQVTLPTLPPSSTPIPCNAAKFVEDITVPDGAQYSPGMGFTKTWRLQNSGTCTWSTGYSLVFVKGDPMGDLKVILLPGIVEPNQTIDISLNLIAPSKTGEYQGYWMLQDTTGNRFGVGSNASNTIWVKIDVVDIENGLVYDFAANYCSAKWESSAGDLPCPGSSNDASGFVIRLDNPSLENRNEDEPALWTNPEDKKDGWIRGIFPPILIKAGDRFLADTGCLANHPKCDVTFQLNYSANGGPIKKFTEWDETYDGDITHVRLDLTPFEGRSVEFILTVLANGSADDDAAFWLVPHVQR
jgi:hypothetical protein